MYFRFLLVLFFFLNFPLSANDTNNIDLEGLIELHKDRILDELVLDSESQESSDISDQALENNNSSNLQTDISVSNNSVEIKKEGVSIDSQNSDINIINSEKLFDLDNKIISYHLVNIIDIKSDTLRDEFINILSNVDLSDLQNNENKVYFIIKKLYEIGEIGKAYNLIKKINKENLTDKKHSLYFQSIELNYLFSRSELEKACELNSSLLKKNIMLPEFLLEKTDIFCLVLTNSISEAKLQNSLLLDSEKIIDQNFQNLLNYMFLDVVNELSFEPLSSFKSKELIFLYSAMLRINELPLDEEFINIDPKNLSIPVILSGSTEMSIRIKAANKAFYDDSISIDSLSALYQSADFSSKEFNKPDQTITSLNNNNELIMAFFYQLTNMQIFPDDRLNVILNYWKFAKEIGLEKIAYANTRNILETFTPTSENIKFGIEIALAHISNKSYEEAFKWINIIENSDDNSDQIDYLKFLIALHKSDNLDIIINYLNDNNVEINLNNNQKISETLAVLNNFLNIESINKVLVYDNISDDRFMPSYFLIEDIKKNIRSQNDLSLFFLSLLSINNKSWHELHPEHLTLILNAYNSYNQATLIKNIILEILSDVEIIQ